MLEDINHDQKKMRHLEKVFLEWKFDSDYLYTIPKKPKSAFFLEKRFCFRQCSFSPKRDF